MAAAERPTHAPADVTTIPLSDSSDCIAEVQNLAARKNPPTAIISANGRLTPYILEGIHSAGLEMPGDVSFMSFGDSQWHRSAEFQARLKALREGIHARYQPRLSTAGFLRRLVIRIRMEAEFRRESRKLGPSRQSLYAAGFFGSPT